LETNWEESLTGRKVRLGDKLGGKSDREGKSDWSELRQERK
jgi:hypothetical protein